jgi:hypothetical protein
MYESLDGHFKERNNSESHMLGTQIPSIFKALVLSTFTYGTKICIDDLNISHWKVLEKGMKMHMMSLIKVCSSTIYQFCWPNLENFP